MLGNINVEHLEKLMTEENGMWLWAIHEGKHWVTNRCFAFYIDVKDAENDENGWELIQLLESKFKTTPLQDSLLVLQFDAVSEKDLKPVETLKKMMLTNIPTNSGIVTPFICAKDYFRYRWAKFSDFNLFIQDKYISVLYRAENIRITSEGPTTPAYLFNGQFLILPVKNLDKTVNADELNAFEEFIKSLELI